MNRRMVRFAAAACALSMAFGSVAVLPQNDAKVIPVCAADAQAAAEGTFGVLTYEKKADGIWITACDPAAETAEIPAEIDGEPVVGIWDDAFMNCALSAVTFPETLKTMGYRAFYGCNNLTEVKFPSSLKRIGPSSFYKCRNLAEISLPEGLETIGSSAFRETALTDVQIPSTVTSFSNQIFDGTPWWDALKAERGPMIIFNHVVVDGRGCEGDVVIPDDVTAIADFAFMETTVEPSKITSIYVPDSVQSIGKDAFAACFSLTSVRLPDHMEEIPIGLLGDCSALESITLPANVKRIRSSAFSNCRNLGEVIFPDHQVDVYSDVFEGTKWLEERRKENPLVIVNGTLIDGRTCTGDVVIPDDVAIISSNAFSWNAEITSVVIPASVKNIWDSTFEWCLNLSSVEILGAEYIGPSAFDGCTALKSLKLSGALKEVGEDAFHGIAGRIPLTFLGSKEQWQQVQIGSGNTILKIAEMTYVVAGDVDNDSNLSVSDVIALQKWLLAVPKARLKNPDAGDLNGDGVVDVYDLALTKRALLAQK